MAKRAPAGEPIYDPLDASLAHSVMTSAGMVQDRKTIVGSGSRGGADENLQQGSHNGHNGRMIVPAHAPKPVSGVAAVSARGFSRAKRVLLTSEEEHQIERLVDRVAEQLGASLKLSHVFRACIAVVCHAEAEVLRQARLLPPLTRPANGDAVALAQFEQAVARLLSLALRDAPPMR